MKRIAIIGAGMGGLSALKVLKAAGHHVTMIDKSRGSGGRMATKKVGDASWDMGTQYFSADDPAFDEEVQNWLKQGWIEEWPIEPVSISAAGQAPSTDNKPRYVGVSRMTALSRSLLAEADEFHPSVRIVDNEKLPQGWMLNSECDQEFGPYDAVILNMPPKQALPLADESVWINTHIDALDMLPSWTLLLAFEQRLDIAFDAADVKDSPIAWIARNNSKPQRDDMETWVIQADTDWTYKMEDEEKSFIHDQLLENFFKITGVTPQVPKEQWLHRWLYAFPEKPLADGALIDGKAGLAVCGDWCHSSSLQGAWLSGRLAASKLLETF